MISQASGSSVRNVYTNTLNETKNIKQASSTASKQGDTSKIDQIKESIASGDYKIDLDALSKKIADELI